MKTQIEFDKALEEFATIVKKYTFAKEYDMAETLMSIKKSGDILSNAYAKALSEIEWLRNGLQAIVDTGQFWSDEGYGVTCNEETLVEIAIDTLNRG